MHAVTPLVLNKANKVYSAFMTFPYSLYNCYPGRNLSACAVQPCIAYPHSTLTTRVPHQSAQPISLLFPLPWRIGKILLADSPWTTDNWVVQAPHDAESDSLGSELRGAIPGSGPCVSHARATISGTGRSITILGTNLVTQP